MTSSCDFDRLGFSDISARRWWTPNALSARRRSALTLSMGSRSGVPVGVRLIVRPAAPATGSPAAPSSNCPLQPPSREENRRTPIALQLLESLCYIFASGLLQGFRCCLESFIISPCFPNNLLVTETPLAARASKARRCFATPAAWGYACGNRVERATSRYLSGRCAAWLKVKNPVHRR